MRVRHVKTPPVLIAHDHGQLKQRRVHAKTSLASDCQCYVINSFILSVDGG